LDKVLDVGVYFIGRNERRTCVTYGGFIYLKDDRAIFEDRGELLPRNIGPDLFVFRYPGSAVLLSRICSILLELWLRLQHDVDRAARAFKLLIELFPERNDAVRDFCGNLGSISAAGRHG